MLFKFLRHTVPDKKQDVDVNVKILQPMKQHKCRDIKRMLKGQNNLCRKSWNQMLHPMLIRMKCEECHRTL